MELEKHLLTPLLLLQGESPRAIEEYRNPRFYIATGELGFGMFAARDLARGELIYLFGGPLIDWLETRRRGERECMAIQVGADLYMDTLVPGCYVNHSCEPNAGIVADHRLIAIETIAKDQEIRFDYSTTMLERSFTMSCRCGKPSCRGTVKDFDWLPEPVQQRYLAEGIVMGFIATVIHSRSDQANLAPGE